jgi:dihydrolipoamide dehydrogenase
MRAHDLGKRVALIEAKRVGGAGLQAGALSSKTMWHLSNDYARMHKAGRGYRADHVDLSYTSVMKSVQEAVSERRNLLCTQLKGLASANIDLIRGRGRFVSPHEVEVTQTDSTLRIEAANFLIATGSKPREPDNIVIDGDRIVTSDHIEDWSEFPESMVIVGAGVIGCEYATIFGQYGRTKIYMIDRRDRILPFEDIDVSECVAKSFENMGVTIHREARLESLVSDGNKVTYKVQCQGELKAYEVERALISIGRVPNLQDLGLELAGIELDQRGGISAENTRTQVPHIYAAGDTTMEVALANVAELEGRQAVESMFGKESDPIDYRAISTIMFLSPEVASVGLGETQAREQGIPYRAARIENKLISRNIAMRNTQGFIKLLATHDDKILGLRVVGPQASSCIQGIALLIEAGGDLNTIAGCVHPHPAVTEGVQECARLLLGRSVLKPNMVEGATVTSYEP